MILRRFITSCILFLVLAPCWASEDCPYHLLLKAKDYDQAIKCAASKQDKVHETLFKWIKYKEDNGSFGDITEFLMNTPHIPSFSNLVKVAEEKIDDNTNHNTIKKWFSKHSPTTPNGIKYYFKVITSNKETLNNKDVNMIKKAFVKGKFSNNERDQLLKKYRNSISQDEIMDRVIYTIWNGDRKIEKQYLLLLPEDKQALVSGIIRILNNERNMQLIDQAVPVSLHQHPDFLYSKALWYKKRGHEDELTLLLISNSANNDKSDDRWFKMRVGVAVDLMEKEDFQNAYKVMASHSYTDPVNYVDAEWLSGRLAYIHLQQPRQGLEHFKNIVDKSKFSTSITKGAYWAALAAQDIDMSSLSESYFVQAAKYPDTYYGQLALMKLGGADAYKLQDAPNISQEDLTWFQNNLYIKIAYSLFQYKKYNDARRFVSAAVLQANTSGQRFLVTEFGREAQIYMMSVVSGKENARRGDLFIENSYPVLPLSKEIKALQVEHALIMSIIRQESEFNQYAKSSAGAMGLMQLIYPTAKDVSRELGGKFTTSALYTDKYLNMRFGTFYLQKLLEYYDGSYILAICSYNAGKGNVDKWLKRFGDPRKLETVDQVVTWIEKIPFYETRGYVQHVLSNIQVYRNVLRSKDKVSVLRINLSGDLLNKKQKASS